MCAFEQAVYCLHAMPECERVERFFAPVVVLSIGVDDSERLLAGKGYCLVIYFAEFSSVALVLLCFKGEFV